ncbi:MAG TPA: TonB-dependent receptor, partial [Thermoanaerobaculia bacterium]
MKRLDRLALSLILLVLLGTLSLLAQGVQTSSLIGTVTGPDGSPLPGVTVTATSPAFMGERQTWTAANGDYIIRGLPPGMYTVRFAMDGMQRVETKVSLSLGTSGRADARMQLAAAAEAITVTAEAPAVLETTTVGANLTAEVVGKIPAGRTVAAIAALAGGVSDSATPVAGQVQINGGMAYDNAMLVNGVNIQDPIFGQIGAANSLFIEGAIQEAQVLTSGISAEYGQFTGGVVNVITKSGGNDFSGSVRLNMSKPDWRDETPFEKERGIRRTGDRNEFLEVTLGGPIFVDRAWFFLAGRDQEGNVPQTLGITGQVADQIETNRRYEVKLTGAVTPSHHLQASYSDNPTERNLELQVSPRELAALARDSKRENDGYVVNYTGVLTSTLFAEARYSEKRFKFINTGGWLTNIEDSPHRHFGLLPGTAAGGGTFVAPYFDSTDPEDRDNEQMYAALSYFWAPPRLGSHDIKLGAERFTVVRTGGNSQSATGFVFSTDYKAAGGSPVLDSEGRMIPVYTSSPVGGTPFTRVTQWIPTRGAELDITTDSYFINDRWNLSSQWSFSLGVRHEQTRSEATGGIVGVD